MKLKRKSAFWLTVFAVGYAILFAIGQMQYQKHGIGRPLWDVDIFYMFFSNLPFHLGKALGVASHELSDNLWTVAVSAFFFIVGMGLYFGEEREGWEGRWRILHFLGAFWCGNLMCNAMASTSIAKVNATSGFTLLAYCAYFSLAMWLLRYNKSGKYAYFRFLCYQVSGLCFALTTAGMLRVIVNMNLVVPFLLPLKTLPHIAGLSFKLAGGLGHAVLALLILFGLTMALVALLMQVKKIMADYFIFFLYTAIIFFLFFICSKSINDNTYTNETIKYWIWILLTLIMWTCRLPKKRIPFFLMGLAAYLLCYVVVMAHYIFFDVYRGSVAVFVSNMLPMKAQLLERVSALFANAEKPVASANAVMVAALIVLTAVMHFVHRFVVSKMTGMYMFPRDARDKNKVHFLDYSQGHHADWPQFWAACVLVGVSVSCLDWGYLVVDMAGLVLILFGIYGYALMTLNDVCKKRVNSVIAMVTILPVMAILLPLYVLFGGGVTAFVFCVVMAIGIVNMGSEISSSEGSGSGGGGGGGGGGGDVQIDMGRQIFNTMWMASSLNFIEKAVNSGAMNYHEGVFYSHLVVDKAAEMGVFGKNDR